MKAVVYPPCARLALPQGYFEFRQVRNGKDAAIRLPFYDLTREVAA